MTLTITRVEKSESILNPLLVAGRITTPLMISTDGKTSNKHRVPSTTIKDNSSLKGKASIDTYAGSEGEISDDRGDLSYIEEGLNLQSWPTLSIKPQVKNLNSGQKLSESTKGYKADEGKKPT